MITDRIRWREVLLQINHKYYTFRGSLKGQMLAKNLENSPFYDFVQNFDFWDIVVIAMVNKSKFVNGSFKFVNQLSDYRLWLSDYMIGSKLVENTYMVF